jgi:hypothetical protein
METWKKADPATSFAQFKQIWVDLAMTYIHSACPDALKQSKWTDLLYQASMGYLWITDFRIKIGAIYTLYLLYMTQPKPDKYKIRMSVAVWKEIFNILDSASSNSLPDVFAVVAKLHERKCCCLYASVSIIPPPGSIPSKSAEDFSKKMGGKGNKLNLDTIGDDAIKLDAIMAADVRYKSHIGNEPSIASKDLLQDLANLKEAASLRIDRLDSTTDAQPSSSMDFDGPT